MELKGGTPKKDCTMTNMYLGYNPFFFDITSRDYKMSTD